MSDIEIESGLTWDQFCELFDRVSANYSKPLDTRVRMTWWKNFGKWWPESDTIAALEYHLKHSKWFPTLAEILECRPKQYKTADDWDEIAQIDWQNQEAVPPTDLTLEQRIDGLDDGELAEIFSSNSPHGRAADSPQVKWLVREFRRHSGGIYRTVVRDLIK